jgi:hypothetical protein
MTFRTFRTLQKCANVVTTPPFSRFVNVRNKKFCLSVCFSVIPAGKKNNCFDTCQQTGESSSSSHFSSCYSSQFKSSKKLNWFLLYLKLETVLSVDLKRTWNTVHISQVLSSFCFQATCIQATWLVWTSLNGAPCYTQLYLVGKRSPQDNILPSEGWSTVCLSGELTWPWSRDAMLNAVLKTLPLNKNIPTVGVICMMFDTMCYQ